MMNIILGACFGFILGLLACDLSPALDYYSERDRQAYDADIDMQRQRQSAIERQRMIDQMYQQRRNPC